MTEAAKHTPGPWDIRTLENFGWNVVHYRDGDRFDILRVAKCGSEDDARLIAAAPDMREALELLRSEIARYQEILAEAERAVEEYSCRTPVAHIATEMSGLASRIRDALAHPLPRKED